MKEAKVKFVKMAVDNLVDFTADFGQGLES